MNDVNPDAVNAIFMFIYGCTNWIPIDDDGYDLPVLIDVLLLCGILSFVCVCVCNVFGVSGLLHSSTFGTLLRERQVGLGFCIGLNMTGDLPNFVLVPKDEDRKRSSEGVFVVCGSVFMVCCTRKLC